MFQMDTKSSWLKDIVFLTLLIGFLYGIMLGSYPLIVPDSARYAEIPREMVVSGDYVTPHINAVKYFEKPPLFYWLQAGAMQAFGFGNLSVNVVNAFFALVTCIMVYAAGRKLYGRMSGVFGGLVLATSGLFFVMGRIVTMDITLTAFLSAALFSFIIGTRSESPKAKRNYFWAMYFFAALAVMTKGLVGIILPGLVIFVWLALFYNQWSELKKYHIFSGIIIFLLIALPWHILVQFSNSEFLHFYFIEQHFLRYLTPYAGRGQELWFLPVVLIIGFFPWICFLPQAIRMHLTNNIERKTDYFLLLWSFLIFVFYMFSDSKLAPYVLPVFPPLALLVGDYFAKLYRQDKTACMSVYCVVAVILGLGIIVFVNFFNRNLLPESGILIYHVIASALLISSIATYMVAKFKPKYAFFTLVTTIGLFLIALPPAINLANNRSIWPLIEKLKPVLNDSVEVACYHSYYQDLPYYLQRRITIVDFGGELEFGKAHGDTSEWMLGDKVFWLKWNSGQAIFLLAKKKDLRDIKKHTLYGKLRVFGEHRNDVIVANY